MNTNMDTDTEQTVEVPIGALRIDPGVQIRVDGLDSDHVAVLAESLDDLPPPRCVRRGKVYVPFDGHHTIAAFQNAERRSIRIRVVSPPADGDLYGAAFDANAVHGKALTLRDKTAFARHLIRLNPETSNMEVARRTGLSPSTVENVREHLEDDEGLERTDRSVTRGGVTYTYPATRRPGELPAKGAAESLSDVGARIFSKPERVRQRRIASFLRRVVVAMEDGADLLSDPDEAAEAARLVLGEDGAELGERLVQAAAPIAKTGRRLAEGL
jgi:hypothetical protein